MENKILLFTADKAIHVEFTTQFTVESIGKSVDLMGV